MKWPLYLPSAFLSLTPYNHPPSNADPPTMTRMTDSCNDVASASVAPREGSTPATTTKSSSRRLFSFVEARRIARGHGFDSREEFVEYSCPGAYQIPKDADVVWREEWMGWEDFLGVPLSFEEGRNVARALDGIDTEESYLDLIKGKTVPDDDPASRLPFRPDLKYKGEWLGWDDFLIG